MTTQAAPVLETERLVLCGHAPRDLDDSAAMWADPLVTRHIGGKPFAREEVWRKLLGYAGHWALLGFGYWVVREKSTGRFVGEVGLADFKRDLTPSIEGIAEAGWVLAPGAHGRGLATEAVRAVLAWHGGPSVCLIDPGNVASLRVADKCGYVEQARPLFHGLPVVLLRRG
jgi:RimJ/RimL family protein N-acetyltransferase